MRRRPFELSARCRVHSSGNFSLSSDESILRRDEERSLLDHTLLGTRYEYRMQDEKR